MLIEKPTGEIRTAYDRDNEPYLFEATGKEAKHFCDILRAEDDGRLVILPCKVGDTVYRVTKSGAILDEVVDDIVMPKFYTRTKDGLRGLDAMWDEFGETVFLAREEAEAAMKEGRNDV